MACVAIPHTLTVAYIEPRQSDSQHSHTARCPVREVVRRRESPIPSSRVRGKGKMPRSLLPLEWMLGLRKVHARIPGTVAANEETRRGERWHLPAWGAKNLEFFLPIHLRVLLLSRFEPARLRHIT